LEDAYGRFRAVSIDYALMEKAQNVVVLPARFGWNDVGHWLAMRDLWKQDAAGNAVQGDVLAIDSGDNIIFGKDRLTALLGVSGLVVVQTEDVTLVCAADRAQELRAVLDELKRRGDERYL
jgi:mannose-1-phosphate guanylyltransferase